MCPLWDTHLHKEIKGRKIPGEGTARGEGGLMNSASHGKTWTLNHCLLEYPMVNLFMKPYSENI